MLERERERESGMRKATGSYRIYLFLVKLTVFPLQTKYHRINVELSHFCTLFFFWVHLQEGLDVTTSDFNTYTVTTYHVLVHTISNIWVDPGSPVVVILATGSEVRGFKLGRDRWIFSARKNPEYDFLRKGNKAVGPVLLIYGTWKNLKPKLEPLSKICLIFHAHCGKRR